MNRRTDRHVEANSHISNFCERALKSKIEIADLWTP